VVRRNLDGPAPDGRKLRDAGQRNDHSPFRLALTLAIIEDSSVKGGEMNFCGAAGTCEGVHGIGPEEQRNWRRRDIFSVPRQCSRMYVCGACSASRGGAEAGEHR